MKDVFHKLKKKTNKQNNNNNNQNNVQNLKIIPRLGAPCHVMYSRHQYEILQR